MLLFSRDKALDAIRVSLANRDDVASTITQARQAEIVLPMQCFVRHLRSVILVMVLVLMLIVISVHPSIIWLANNALISVYNSDYINQAYNVVETIPTRNSKHWLRFW